jgi:hypothetical protein
VVFFEKFPNGLQIIFLRYAGFIALQRVPQSEPDGRFGIPRRSMRSRAARS